MSGGSLKFLHQAQSFQRIGLQGAARKIFFHSFTRRPRRGDRKYKILLGNAEDYGTFPRDNIVAIESVTA